MASQLSGCSSQFWRQQRAAPKQSPKPHLRLPELRKKDPETGWPTWRLASEVLYASLKPKPKHNIFRHA